MVDISSIRGGGLGSIANTGVGSTEQTNGVSKIAEELLGAKTTEKTEAGRYEDTADVSLQAKQKAATELAAAKFSRLAQRLPEEAPNQQKIDFFKELLANGGTEAYLSKLDNTALADAILAGPVGGAFR